MMPPLGRLSEEHLKRIQAHFVHSPAPTTAASRSYRRLLAHYYNRLIPANASVLEVGCGDGELLAQINARRKTGIDLSAAQIARARARIPEGQFHVQAGEQLALPETFEVIILSETLDHSADVQRLLDQLATVATAETRLLINFHNNLWRPLFALGEWIHLRAAAPPGNWLSSLDIEASNASPGCFAPSPYPCSRRCSTAGWLRSCPSPAWLFLTLPGSARPPLVRPARSP
jgi:SAM-dependent methyltransferase